MKFCPECGSKLPKGIEKSCSICGISLQANTTSDTIIALPQQPTEYTPLQQGPQSLSADELGKEDKMEGEFQNQIIKLQKTIEEFLRNKEIFQGQTVVESTKYRELRLAESTKLAEYTKYHEARFVEIKKPPLLSANLSINLSSLL